MPYSPKDFGDVAEKATMAPSELQPPLNFADGGAVNWAGDSTVYNTQSQIGNMMATPGGFGGMSAQFTSSAPFSQDQNPFSGYQDPNQMQDQGQEQGFDFSLGTVLQPMPTVPPPPNPTIGSFSTDAYNSITPPLSGGNTIPQTMDMPEAAMAKGGNVSNLISRLKGEFSKRGLDFDRAMAQRLANKGQKGDTMLAHINPDEAQMLKDAGGSGKINPDTGLPSFGVDDGPERGSTGSASGASYGGGSSVGSGGGSNQSANAAMGRESPSERDSSYTGGGNDRNDRSDRSDQSTPSPAAARAAENASMAKLADIMATSPAQLMSDKMRQDALNLSARNQEIIQAEKDQNARVKNYETLKSLGALQDTRPTEYDMAAAMSGKTPAQITGFEAPTGKTTTFDPSSSGIVPTGSFKTEDNSAFKSVFKSILSEATAPLAVLKDFQKTQTVPTAPTSSTAGLYGYTPPSAPITTVNPMSPAALRAMENKSMSSLAAAQAQAPAAKTFDEYNATSAVSQNIPVPIPVPGRSPIQTTGTVIPSSTNIPIPVARPTDQQKNIFDVISDMNAKRIAELEKQNQFIGGNKEQVAAALNVDPSELQSRIVNYDGTQKVDYFTKGMDQALAEMVTGPFQAISNLFGSNVNQTPRGSYVRDQRFSDLFSQNVPSKGYGPYGDLTLEEYNKQYGGRDQQTGAGAPVTTPTVPVTPAPEVPAPEVPATPLASFKRKYIPLTDYASYGYGPESTFYEYQAAQGGSVGPLSQKRK